MTDIALTLTPPDDVPFDCPECGLRVTEILLGACGRHAEIRTCGCVVTQSRLNDALRGHVPAEEAGQ